MTTCADWPATLLEAELVRLVDPKTDVSYLVKIDIYRVTSKRFPERADPVIGLREVTIEPPPGKRITQELIRRVPVQRLAERANALILRSEA